MKKKNHLIKPILAAILFGIFTSITSCSDDFSEEDFLKQQYELAEQKSAADHARDLAIIAADAQRQLANIMAQGQNALALGAAQAQYAQELARLQQLIAQETRAEFLEAYRKAGLLVKGNIIILDAVSNQALSGATVKLFGKEATTSAQGVASFDDIPIGGGDVEITATDYYKATSPGIIPYVQPTTAGNGGLPIQRTISATLKMVANGSITNSSVTVNGKVTLDSNLTNAITEFPTNAKVEIDYAAALSPSTNTDGINFSSYQLDNPDFQPATINPSTGEYTIMVPAINGVKLILPIIEQEVTYIEKNPSYDAVTNPDVDEFLLKKEMGVFNINTTDAPDYQDAITTTNLYEYKFDALKGSGFDLSFKQLFTDLYRNYNPGNSVGYTSFNVGEGYTSIPTVALVANGSDAINDDKVWLKTNVTIKDLTFTGGKAPSITDATTYNVFVTYTNSNGIETTGYIGNIETEVSGATIIYKNLNIVNSSLNNVHSIDKYYLNGIVDADQPSVSHELENISINSLSIASSATKGTYTSWPAVTFTGGSPNINASFSIDPNRSTQWEVSVNNAGSNYEAFPEIKYKNIFGPLYDLRNNSNQNIATTNLVLNTGGTISLNTSNLITNYIRPSEIATMVEDKLPENSGASLNLNFTANTDEDNDITSIGFTSNVNYKSKPNHSMLKKYTWVTDATTPLELDIVYFNNVAPLTATLKAGTGKGYMNPQPQTAIDNPLNISSNNSGQTITRNFMYGVGKLKQ